MKPRGKEKSQNTVLVAFRNSDQKMARLTSEGIVLTKFLEITEIPDSFTILSVKMFHTTATGRWCKIYTVL